MEYIYLHVPSKNQPNVGNIIPFMELIGSGFPNLVAKDDICVAKYDFDGMDLRCGAVNGGLAVGQETN